jgi:hypothetical protein
MESNLMIAGGDLQAFKEAYGDAVDFEKIKLTLDAMNAESNFWKKVSDSPTPYDSIEIREHDDLEYVKEYYVISEFNRLFPGWTQEGMETLYVPELRTVRQTGYIVCPMIDLVNSGIKLVKRWTVGAKQVQGKKEDKSNPSNPEYVYASADTVWLRRAGKKFGIALDIYTQAITPEMQRIFEDKVRYWGTYAEPFMRIAKTIEKGKTFRSLLRSLPSQGQTARFIKIINSPLLDREPERKHKLWLTFVNSKNHNATETNKLNTLLTSLEQKLNIQEGE